jgi:hypothetical protein
MSRVLQDVVDYVEMARPGFAVLIAGPWGCGKTYFWKRVAEPKLKQVATSRRVLYASLYGVKDARSIDTQLLLALCSESIPEGLNRLAEPLRKKLKQLASGAAGVAKALVNKYAGFDVYNTPGFWDQ